MFQPNSCSSRRRLAFSSSGSHNTDGTLNRRGKKQYHTNTIHYIKIPTGTMLNSLSLNQIEEHIPVCQRAGFTRKGLKLCTNVCMFMFPTTLPTSDNWFVECKHIYHINLIRESVEIVFERIYNSKTIKTIVERI